MFFMFWIGGVISDRFLFAEEMSEQRARSPSRMSGTYQSHPGGGSLSTTAGLTSGRAGRGGGGAFPQPRHVTGVGWLGVVRGVVGAILQRI